jgi:hypothetical protein
MSNFDSWFQDRKLSGAGVTSTSQVRTFLNLFLLVVNSYNKALRIFSKNGINTLMKIDQWINCWMGDTLTARWSYKKIILHKEWK